MPPRKTTTKTAVKTEAVLDPKAAIEADDVTPATVDASQVAETTEVLNLGPNEDTFTAVDTFESVEGDEVAALRAELARAKEELAQRDSTPSRPLPEEALTPEQRQIRELQDQLARANGQRLDDTRVEEELSGEGILIHVLEDGFDSKYRGQEVVYGPKAYEETKNRYGISWLHMTDEEQYERWGKVQFRKGPWPGKKNYEDEGAKDKSIRTVASVSRD